MINYRKMKGWGLAEASEILMVMSEIPALNHNVYHLHLRNTYHNLNEREVMAVGRHR